MTVGKTLIPLDSKSAVTVFKSICILRTNPREELTSVDLENILAQALWKSFDRLRGGAAERLQTDEVDLLLTDARVIGIKIDGHRVHNPEGFTGREIELTLCLTIVRRDKLPAEGGEIFEEGSVRAYLTAIETNKDGMIYVDSGSDLTTVFLVAPELTSYLGEFGWGQNDLVRAFTSGLDTAAETGKALYLQYAGGGASPRVTKRLDEIFYNSFGTFVNGITMAIRNSFEPRLTGSGSGRGRSALVKEQLPAVYLRSFILPESVWSKNFFLGDRKTRFMPAPEVDLVGFIDDNQNSVYGELNRLARRRIKWLMPEKESK